MFNTFMQGIVLLVAGMGIVYLFLSLMVWVMNRFASIIPRFNHILPDEEPKKKTRKPAKPSTTQHASHLAAVAIPHDATGTEIKSALPGAVLRISVKTGDHVAKDDELIVLDVMKMETPVKAVKDGVVTAIRVAVGEKVNTGDLLAVIA